MPSHPRSLNHPQVAGTDWRTALPEDWRRQLAAGRELRAALPPDWAPQLAQLRELQEGLAAQLGGGEDGDGGGGTAAGREKQVRELVALARTVGPNWRQRLPPDWEAKLKSHAELLSVVGAPGAALWPWGRGGAGAHAVRIAAH